MKSDRVGPTPTNSPTFDAKHLREIYNNARRRAHVSGVPFTISADDIPTNQSCPICGVPFQRTKGRGMAGKASPSLDRIIPERGYVPGNLVMICKWDNSIKTDAGVERISRVATFYKELFDKCQTKTETPSGSGDCEKSTASQNLSHLPPKTTSKRSSSITTQTASATNITALIDGDILAYKAAFGNESEHDLGDDVISLQADLGKIETSVDDLVTRICDKLGTTNAIIALSDDTNFRKGLYADYKANRSPRRKPIGLRHAKLYMEKKWSVRKKPGLEADDVLGIMLSHPTLFKNTKPVCVTTDKDLLQIPGRHYNPDKDTKRMVSVEQGDWQFYMQCLTGDSTDNYPGCKGVGPKTAERILADADKPWERVLATYTKAGFDETFAINQARLARILRHTDYDYEKKEPILWTPS